MQKGQSVPVGLCNFVEATTPAIFQTYFNGPVCQHLPCFPDLSISKTILNTYTQNADRMSLRLLFLATLISIILGDVDGQVTIFTEDFTYADGTTSGPTWDASLFNNCDADVINGVDFNWGVFGNEFVISDAEGFNCCEINGLPNPAGQFGDSGNTLVIGPINISGYLSIEINLDFTTSGDYECAFTDFNGEPCPGADAVPYCQGGHDQAIFSYQIDGGAPIVFGYYCGDNFCFGQPFFCGDVSGSDLNIIITAGTQSDSEAYALDNIEVVGFNTPNAEATANGSTGSITLCEGDQLDLDEIGGEANSWLWSGPNSFSSSNQNPSISNVSTNEAGDYTVEITTASGCSSTSTVTVNIDPSPIATPPPPLIVCYSLAPPNGEVLNLNDVIEAIRNFDPSLTVNWFFDAAATMPLDPFDPGDIFTLINNGQTTVYATVEDGNCESAPVPVSIDLNLYPDPPDGSLMECPASNGMATFTPSDADGQFTGGDPNLTVSYHPTPTDAEDNTGAITGDVTTATDLTLFVRVENDAGCAAVAELDLIVTSSVTASPASMEACDDGSGQATFDLTTLEATILNGESGTVLFYEDMATTSPILNPGSYTTSTTTVYAVIDDGMGCISEPVEIDLTVLTIDPADAFLSFSPDAGCGDTEIAMTLNTPADPFGEYTFNVSFGPVSAGPVSTGNFMGFDGDTPFLIGINEDYIFVLNSVTGPGPLFCQVNFSPGIEYIIPIADAPDAFPASITACPNAFGEGTFDLTLLENTINGNTGLPVDFYQDINLTSFINNPSSYVSPEGTIFAVVDAGGGCVSEPVAITLLLEETPDPVDFTLDITSSCTSTDVTLTFNLPNGEAYNFDLLITDGGGTITSSYSGITNLSTLTFNVSETTTFSIEEIQSDFGCFYTLDPAPSQTITIGATGAMPNTASLSACDDGSGSALFDLTLVDDTVNGGSGETVIWFEDMAGTNPINNPDNYSSTGGTIYAALDIGGCLSETVAVTLSVEPAPDVSITLDQAISCAGSADGAITANVVGTAPFSFDWNDDTYDGQQSLSGLAAGFYAVTIIDGNDCEGFADITLNDPAVMTISCTVVNDETSPGANDGQAFFTVTDGSPLYEAMLSGPTNLVVTDVNSGFVFTGLPPGNYNLTVTDANGCSADCSFTINPSTCNFDIDVTVGQISCAGANDATIDVSTIGGTPNFTYDWSDDQYDGMSSLTGLGPGNYSVTVSDDMGCTAEESIDIMEPSPLSLMCRENMVGEGSGENSYTFFYSGGTPFYQLELTGPVNISFTENVAGSWDTATLPPGSYTFTITDGNGCSESCSFDITPDCDLSLELTGTDPTCAGEMTGSLNLVISSSHPIILIDWDDDNLDGQTNPTGLGAGTFNVTVADDLGCVQMASTTLTDPPAYDANCVATSLPSGPGANDGSLAITINSGPGGPYTVTYDDGNGNNGTIAEGFPANSFTQNNLPPGLYQISISNGAGCTSSCSVDLQVPPCPLTINQSGIPPSCSDSADGSASVSPQDGTMPYTYDWSDDAFDGLDTATGLTAGLNISVTVTDAVGCVGTVNFLVPTPAAVTLDCSNTTNPTGMGTNDGQADVVVGGGTAPYMLSWSGPSSGNMNVAAAGNALINNLAAGTYTITLEDANGCQTSCTFTLSAPGCDLSLDLQGTNPSCAGEASGSLDLSIDGSFPIVSIDWSEDTFDGTEDPTNVSAGTYTVTVTDNQGCTASTSLTLVDPPALFLNCSQTTNPSTNISTDGAVDVVIAGGTPGYTLSWSGPVSGSTMTNNAGTFTIDNLSVGSYSIVLEDANGCTETCNFVLVEEGTCTFDLTINTLDESCPGAADGSAIAMPSGGAAPYMYDWSTMENTALIENLAAGPYSVIVTDANDCVSAQSIDINTANPMPTFSVGNGSTICADSCYYLPVSFTGTAPYTLDYTLETGGMMTNQQVVFMADQDSVLLCPASDGIAVGNFSLSFTNLMDANCQAMLNETVNFSYLPPAVGDLISTICPEDTVFVGGEAFYLGNPMGTVVLPNAATSGCDSTVNVALDFFPISVLDLTDTICPEDTLTVGGVDFHLNNPSGQVVLDNASVNGCDSTINVNLSFYPESDFFLNATICSEDTLIVGMDAYHFDNPSGLTVLEGASQNGCDSTVFVNLFFFPEIEVNITDELCQGDTLFIGGQAFHSGLLSDTIVLENAGMNGCDSTIFVNLMEILPATTSRADNLCAGDTLTIAGVEFTEDFLQQDIVLAGQAANGCDSIIMVNLNLIPLSPTPLDMTLCPGDSLLVGDSVFNTPGSYAVLIENGSTLGCDSLVQVELQYYPPASSTENGTYCAGETVEIGGQTFDVNNSSGTVVLPNASVNGCDSTITVDLLFLPAALNNLDTLLCFGESLTIGTQTFDAANASGIVVLPNAAANGCDSTIFVNTTYRPELFASIGPDTTLCGAQTVDGILYLSPGTSYDFTVESSTGFQLSVDGVNNDTYSFGLGTITQDITLTLTEITSTDGCAVTIEQAEAEIRYSDTQVNLASIGGGAGTTDLSCADASDGSVQAIVTGGVGPFTYDWNTGDDDVILDNLTAGTYSVTVTDLPGCTAEATITLTAPSAIVATLDGISSGCFGSSDGSIVIESISGGTAPYEFSLDGEFFQTLDPGGAIIPNLTAGAYTVFVQDANDCQLSLSTGVPEATALQLELGEDETIKLGDSILLDPQFDFTPASWTWTPIVGLSQPDTFVTYAAPLETTVYQLEMADENGCTVSDIIRIIVERDLNVYVPSAFSPDGDGTNDVFMIFAGQGVEEVESFQIFDRWGDQVFFKGPFQPNDPLYGWDGTHNGQDMNAAVFVYFAEIRLVTGERVMLEGEVLLLR